MKILFISSWYPTLNSPFSGIFIKEHAVAIKRKDVDIVVYNIILESSNSIFKVTNLNFIDEEGINTFQIIIKSKFKNFIYYFPILQYLYFYKFFFKHIYSIFNPDLIHANVSYPSGIFANKLAKKLRIPYIITEHWSKLEYISKIPIISKSIKYSYNNAVRILPVSKFLKQKIFEQIPSLQENKFQIIQNIGNTKIFNYKIKDNQEDTIRYCAVATWNNKNIPDKFPELFMEALNIFQKKTSKKIFLTIVGGGNKIDEMKKLSKKMNYEINFKGFLSKKNIAEELYKTDFFLHASRIETFGIVILESLLTGTPVICSNVGALPELVNSSNGILTENTVNDWVIALEKSLTKKYNHKKISDDIKKLYDVETVGEKIVEVYKFLDTN